jgi:YYY domain-containing protein
LNAAPAPSRLPNWLVYLLLVALLASGLALRTWHVDFDYGAGSHPDERSTACFYATPLRLPDSWDQFWEPHQSPLNPLWSISEQRPRSFTYGHFPLYLGAAAAQGLSTLAPLAERAGFSEQSVALIARAHVACDGMAVAGRLVMALLDTLTILLVFLLGGRLFGRGAGLLAAALYTFTAQAVQLSHFFAMDPASTTFTVLAIWGAVLMVQERSWRGLILTGVGAGLAIASKFSALPILAAPVVAAVAILYSDWRESRATNLPSDGRTQLYALLGIPFVIALAGLAFFVTSPYAILDWRNFLQATLVEQGAMVRGVADMPFTRQYRNTVPYLYFIQQQVQWGMWWPLGIVSLGGVGWGLWRLLATLWQMVRGHVVARPVLSELLVWAWLIPYFGLTGAFLAKFNRYMSPVLPFVMILTAGMLVALLARSLRWQRWLGALLATIALLGGIFWSIAYVNGVYNRDHTWYTASRWMYENIDPGSVILWEQWDDPLPKSIPNEPAMDRGAAGLTNIDWGPYEEDTAQKYEIMKQKLREADYVAYSSKRIYDSVDELPLRYPMTNRYYDAMWDGRLGFELAAEFTSPPTLFGFTFDDRSADESWSLYDHPQVTIFRKARDLSDAEFDALFAGTWQSAIPYDRGPGTPLQGILSLAGLGSSPESANDGIINRVTRALLGDSDAGTPEPLDPTMALLETPLRDLPVVDDFRWNVAASELPWLAVLTWWAVTLLLGWLAWPLAFALFQPLRDRGYFVSRTLGWLLAGWMLWVLASLRLLEFTVVNAWISVGLLAALSAAALTRHARGMGQFLRHKWPLLLVGEALFGAAFLGFVGLRILNPDIWQPWFGGEKFMEMAFLTGILRSPWFPPVDPHFAGGFINYYYFGLYLVAYLIKLTGIYAEVAFNLAIPMLFALTVAGAYGVAYSAITPIDPARPERVSCMRRGLGAALWAPLFVAVIGNLDGFAQVVRSLSNLSSSTFQSEVPGVQPLVRAASGLQQVLTQGAALPPYDFWGPSRVIPATINEFPWWSFLFADLHPHLIGIPIALLFLAAVLTLIRSARLDWGEQRLYAGALLGLFALLLGTLAAINLWELPTYLGLGVMTLIVSQFWGCGRIRWGMTIGLSTLFVLGAFLLYAPFFAHFSSVGASGIGFVRQGDDVNLWLLIWGFLGFVVVSWLLWTMAQPARPVLLDLDGDGNPGAVAHPAGFERLLSFGAGRLDDLPRYLHLQRVLGVRPRLGYLLLQMLTPLAFVGAALAFWLDRTVLALCILPLTLAFLLLWRRGRAADAGAQFAVLLAVTGFAVLAGTQIVYLKDFLSGGDWYRMNTLFKFFSQAWVLFGVAAAIVLPRVWGGWVRKGAAPAVVRWLWAGAFGLLLLASLAYTFIGTPARLEQRLAGWRPPLGTLDGFAYMQQGAYTWPDGSNTIELAYDYPAIKWILANVRGNATVMETSETDYYRAGSSRVASLTGLSGLKGFHAGEQRPGEQVSPRDGLHREFWSTPDIARMQQILDEVGVDLVYVGQLERYLHPDGIARLEQMAATGALVEIYANERTTLYAVRGRMARDAQGRYLPASTVTGAAPISPLAAP